MPESDRDVTSDEAASCGSWAGYAGEVYGEDRGAVPQPVARHWDNGRPAPCASTSSKSAPDGGRWLGSACVARPGLARRSDGASPERPLPERAAGPLAAQTGSPPNCKY